MSRNALISFFLFIVILVFFSMTYYHEMLYMMPQGIHEWAQSDRLSLAMNFYDRGMNFFKPATHNLYPTDGITGVEFPLQSYLAALMAKVTGRNTISTCFRLLDVIISCTGLLFLFLACYKRTKDLVFSMVPPLFIYCSPVYVYYTCNYLPDAAACSISFIGFYFLLQYIDTSTRRSLLLTLVFLTLATLVKTSLGVYLAGFMGYVVLQRLLRKGHFSKQDNLLFISGCIVSILLVAGYMVYNRYLNETYHSGMFMAQARPFENWDAVAFYFNNSFKYVYIDEYLVLPQYLMFVAIVAPAIPMMMSNIAGKKRLLLLLLFFCGTTCIFFLLGAQLTVHDYYIVSIFLPLLAFALTVSITTIYEHTLFTAARQALRISIVSGLLIVFFFSDFHIHKRLKAGYKGISSEVSWAQHGAEILFDLHIPEDEKILVLNEVAPNTALVYLDRRGYNTPPDKWKTMEGVSRIMNQLHLEIVACEEGIGRNVIANDSTFAQHFETLILKDRVAVFKLVR